MGNGSDAKSIQLTQKGPGPSPIELMEQWFDLIETGRSVVAIVQALEMIRLPGRLRETDLADFQSHGVAADRNRQPLDPVLGANSIAISPVVFGVLDFIVKNKYVGAPDQIEITLPGEIIGLEDNHAHNYSSWSG